MAVGSLRIIGGELRGRKITVPPSGQTRPTSDRARQALFNILEHNDDLPGWSQVSVVDLYAGSGALGFEALSRGANFCTFVDQDREVCATLQKTAQDLGLKGRVTIIKATVESWKGPQNPADLIFMDPPYRIGASGALIDQMLNSGWLTGSAIIVTESASSGPQFTHDLLHKFDSRTYGAARLDLLKQKIQ